jgi:hypothetical protein
VLTATASSALLNHKPARHHGAQLRCLSAQRCAGAPLREQRVRRLGGTLGGALEGHLLAVLHDKRRLQLCHVHAQPPALGETPVQRTP